MTSFWLADRNRSELNVRLPPRVAGLMRRLQLVRERLLNHPIYAEVRRVEDLHTYMRFHVWAVWDFMSLLKQLQRLLSCVEVPWVPVGDPYLRRLVNEIVVSEETDEDGKGSFAAHFELYLGAMDQCGADTSAIKEFVGRLRAGEPLDKALAGSSAPAAAQRFCKDTFAVISSGSLPAIASAFTFSREDVVPIMFKQIADRLRVNELGKYDRFLYYLDRHIAVDSDSHGPMAFEMIDRICGDDPRAMRDAEDAARATIEARCRLWDGALAAIKGAGTTAATAGPARNGHAGVQFRGTILPGQTARWHSAGWPDDSHVVWSALPTAPGGGAGPQLAWKVITERGPGRYLNYWIVVKNVSAAPVPFEVRYVVVTGGGRHSAAPAGAAPATHGASSS